VDAEMETVLHPMCARVTLDGKELSVIKPFAFLLMDARMVVAVCILGFAPVLLDGVVKNVYRVFVILHARMVGDALLLMCASALVNGRENTVRVLYAFNQVDV